MLSRPDAVSALAAEPFDVLVVGGAITGAGVALDAATRGYSVALVERADYAIGTSSRSSKLHGGLRYLQNFDLGLVREALLERQLNVAHEVLRVAAERPELAAPIQPGMPDLLAEAAHAARNEQARTVGDVLLRRTRLALTAAPQVCAPGAAAPRAVAEVLAAELGCDVERETAAFRAEAAAEGVVV